MSLPRGLQQDQDGTVLCKWPGTDAEYRHYHHEEWGHPVTDDFRLFEKICLEGFQSGLSWLTILRKRVHFRAAFHDFDFNRIATYDDGDVARLLGDAGIVRHRGKIVSTINNAQRAILLKQEFGSLAAYFWRFEPPASERPARFTYEAMMANPTPPAATRLSKDLKKRGWSFVGPTTAYAFMQAMGLVNDHIEGCACRARLDGLRARLVRPV